MIGKTISHCRILDKLGAGAADSSRITAHSPGNKRVSRLFSVTTDSVPLTSAREQHAFLDSPFLRMPTRR
jgi:hypothetical protein